MTFGYGWEVRVTVDGRPVDWTAERRLQPDSAGPTLGVQAAAPEVS